MSTDVKTHSVYLSLQIFFVLMWKLKPPWC